MQKPQRMAQLAIEGRARLLHLDMRRGVCMVRFNPPAGGAAGWPSNVVALRPVAYSVARSMRGLIK